MIMAATVTCDECDATYRLRDNLRYCPECGASLREPEVDEPEVDDEEEEGD